MKINIPKLLILFVVSIIFTYIISLVEVLIRGTFFSGMMGLPLRFDNTTFFGGGEMDNVNLFLDVLFWFVVLWLLWYYLPKVFKH